MNFFDTAGNCSAHRGGRRRGNSGFTDGLRWHQREFGWAPGLMAGRGSVCAAPIQWFRGDLRRGDRQDAGGGLTPGRGGRRLR